jgi:phage host-nuclease inhibitor protein Gam
MEQDWAGGMFMPRKAVPKAVPAIERPRSWEDVDRLVHLTARTEGQMATAKAAADEEVRLIGAALQKRLAPLAALAGAMRVSVETFASAHRPDFGGERSMVLAHGRVGWRASPPAVKLLRPAEEIVAVLEERGLDAAVLITKRPSKDILATYPEDLLKELGVRLTQRDDFYVEFAEASVSEAPQRT